MTRGQFSWAVAGIAVIVVVASLARGNVAEIYKAEPDFFLGALLSLTGFCFAKAFSRANVNAALELIRDDRVPEVAEALEREMQRRLHDRGIHQQIALLHRNITAANKRTCEYFDLQTRDPRFYLTSPLIRIILQDLDDALSNVTHLAHAVGSQDAQHTFSLSPDVRSQLNDALRDLLEATARRNETYEALTAQFESVRVDDLWGAFTVMTSDVLKAQRDLEALLGRNILASPKDRVIVLAGYVTASLKRARVVEELIEQRGLSEPPALKVMLDDLEKVLEKLARVELGSPMLTGAPATR